MRQALHQGGKDVHTKAKVNAIVQAIIRPTRIQVIVLNLEVVKIRLYIRRTLILVSPTAGNVNISSAYVVYIRTISYRIIIDRLT